MEKPIGFREVLQRDVRAVIDHYLRQAGPDIALGFIDALQATYQAIAVDPALGSPRYASEPSFPDCAAWRRRGFPISFCTSTGTITSTSRECFTPGATDPCACGNLRQESTKQ